MDWLVLVAHRLQYILHEEVLSIRVSRSDLPVLFVEFIGCGVGSD